MDTQNRIENLLELFREAQSNGYIDTDIYYMDEFEDIQQLTGYNTWEVARSIHHGDFNPYHNYFKVDVYGHFYSYSDMEVLEDLEGIEDELKEFLEEINNL